LSESSKEPLPIQSGVMDAYLALPLAATGLSGLASINELDPVWAKATRSGYLDHDIDLDRDIERQRRHTHDRAGVPPALQAKDLDEQI
jgi:hypothetical protein